MFKTNVGPVEDAGVGRVPPTGDGAGHLRQLRERDERQPQEAAVRHRADRQVVPQRDHARQLRVPHPRVRADGDGVLRAARRRHRSGTTTGAAERHQWYLDLGIPPDKLRLRPHDDRRAQPLLDSARPTSSSSFPWGWDELEGVAQRTDFDLNPPLGALRREARLLRPGDRHALHAVRDRACGGRDAHDDGVPHGGVRRGRGARRDAHRAPAPSPAGAVQGGRAAPVEEA